MREKWTIEQTNMLCEFMAEGLTFAYAAKRIGKSRSAIQSRWRKVLRSMGWQSA